MMYVVTDGDNYPEMVLEDRELAESWASALGSEFSVWPFDVTTVKPEQRTWYTCQAVPHSSVHIPTGQRTTEIRLQVFTRNRWSHRGRDGHTFRTPEEAQAHAETCDICGTP